MVHPVFGPFRIGPIPFTVSFTVEIRPLLMAVERPMRVVSVRHIARVVASCPRVAANALPVEARTVWCTCRRRKRTPGTACKFRSLTKTAKSRTSPNELSSCPESSDIS